MPAGGGPRRRPATSSSAARAGCAYPGSPSRAAPRCAPLWTTRRRSGSWPSAKRMPRSCTGGAGRCGERQEGEGARLPSRCSSSCLSRSGSRKGGEGFCACKAPDQRRLHGDHQGRRGCARGGRQAAGELAAGWEAAAGDGCCKFASRSLLPSHKPICLLTIQDDSWDGNSCNSSVAAPSLQLDLLGLPFVCHLHAACIASVTNCSDQ